MKQLRQPLRGLRIEIFDHDLAVGVHQLPHELADGLPAQVHASAVQLCELGFRSPVSSRSGDGPGECSFFLRRSASVVLSGAGFGTSMTLPSLSAIVARTQGQSTNQHAWSACPEPSLLA